MAILNCSVVVRDENFVTHVFNAGESVPEWVREQVSNPDVWASEVEVSDESPEPTAEDAEQVSNPDVKIPPKSGRGSSAAAWAEYAASHGFEVDADAKASEIREALEAEGIPTE